MTHPHDLLAEHVDGTLGDEDRAAIEAHLATCEVCRDEAALARRARGALGALTQPAAPVDVGTRAIAEAAATGGEAAVPDHRRWYRWAGAAAGVAAVLLVVALVAPNLSNLGGDAATMAGDDARETAASFPPASVIEIVEGNLGPDDLAAFAETARSAAAAGAPDAEADGAAPEAEGTPEAVDTATEAIEGASACLRTAFPTIDGPPVRLISATFQGTPAWIGIFREASEGAEALQVIAADRNTCTILSTATARL